MRKLDISATAKKLSAFIEDTMTAAGKQHVIVALSGGVDSSTATALAVRGLGAENVFPLLLPYRHWHQEGVDRARSLVDRLGIPGENVHQVDIGPMADAFLAPLDLQPLDQDSEDGGADGNQVRVGNIMARVRMIVAFDHAKQLGALILGTENKSEYYLGYFTRCGDEASDLEPLRVLYKTEIFQVAEHLGVPQAIIEATPSAGLWPGQTDEGELGFTYADADRILYGLYDGEISRQELVAQGLDEVLIEKVRSWVERVEFKHEIPYLAPEPVLV